MWRGRVAAPAGECLMSMNAMPNVAGGGEPPYDKEMDRRLTVLETRFDTILPTLATKSDLEALRSDFRIESGALRAELSKALNDTMLRLMALCIALVIGSMGVNIALYSSLRTLIVNSQPVASKVPKSPAPSRQPQVAQQASTPSS